MSRHVLIDEPTLQLVVGFDAPLRYFFGLVYDPSRETGEAGPFDGWPTRIGLGIQPPIFREERAKVVLASLALWLTRYIPDPDVLVATREKLLAEWRGEPARPEPIFSKMLREARP